MVGDLAVAARHEDYKGAVWVLQNCIYRIEGWVNKNGLKFSVEKKRCVNFSLKGTFDPQLTLNGRPTKHIKITRFLGLIFDKRLTYAPPSRDIKAMTFIRDKVKVLFSGRETPKAVSGQEIDENYVFQLLLFFIIRTSN